MQSFYQKAVQGTPPIRGKWFQMSAAECMNYIEAAVEAGRLEYLGTLIGYGEEDSSFDYVACAFKNAKGNLDVAEYLLEYHLKRIDFEEALSEVISNDDFKIFPLLYARIDDALDYQHDAWRLLGIEDEQELKTLDDLAAKTSKDGKNLYNKMHMLEVMAQRRSKNLLTYMIEQDGLNENEISYILSAWLGKTTQEHDPEFLNYLMEKGAKVDVVPPAELMTLIKNSTKAQESEHVISVLRSKADQVMEAAIRGYDFVGIKILNTNVLDGLNDKGAHVRNILSRENKSLYDIFLAHPSYSGLKEVAEWIADNTEETVNKDRYLEAARVVDLNHIEERYLTALCSDKATVNAWAAFEMVLDRGFDVSKFPKESKGLLRRALFGNASSDVLSAVLKAPKISQKKETLLLAIKRDNVRVIRALSDKYGVLVHSHLDWQAFYDLKAQKDAKIARAETEIRRILSLEQNKVSKKVDAFFETLDFKATTREDWQKTLLHRAAASPQCGDILQKLKDETGICLSSEDFQYARNGRTALDIACCLRHENALLDHPYWREDMQSLENLYADLPDYARHILGDAFINDYRLKNALHTMTGNQAPLKRRRPSPSR